MSLCRTIRCADVALTFSLSFFKALHTLFLFSSVTSQTRLMVDNNVLMFGNVICSLPLLPVLGDSFTFVNRTGFLKYTGNTDFDDYFLIYLTR